MNQRSYSERLGAKCAGSRKNLANIEHEAVEKPDICAACSEAKLHKIRELGAVTKELRGPNPHAIAYLECVSADIARRYHECWFCRLIHRFCAQLMSDEKFVKWRADNIKVEFIPTNGVWKTQFLGAGTAEDSEITFLVRINDLRRVYDQFQLACYPKDNLPSRAINNIVSPIISDEIYIQKIRRWLSFCDSAHSKCVFPKSAYRLRSTNWTLSMSRRDKSVR